MQYGLSKFEKHGSQAGESDAKKCFFGFNLLNFKMG